MIIMTNMKVEELQFQVEQNIKQLKLIKEGKKVMLFLIFQDGILKIN